MKYVPNVISRTVGLNVLRAKKNSPQLLFVAGVVGLGATVFLTARATLKVDGVLVDHEKEMLDISRVEKNTPRSDTAYWEQQRRLVTLRTTGKLIKLYAPTAVAGVVTIACLTVSHRQLTNRNAALTAAYVGLQKFLDEYRGRVREKVGATEEKELYYSSTPVELVRDTENGPEKYFASSPGRKSPYACLFDDRNGNWVAGDAYNRHFVNLQSDLLTNKLRAQGSLMLNEVYDRLDMPRTAAGAVCGWIIGPDYDDFVDITIEPVHDFHGSLMLDFNVQGVVYEMLSGRASGRRE